MIMRSPFFSRQGLSHRAVLAQGRVYIEEIIKHFFNKKAENSGSASELSCIRPSNEDVRQPELGRGVGQIASETRQPCVLWTMARKTELERMIKN